MTDAPTPPPVRRARSYAWRLLVLLPALAMLGVGLWYHRDVADHAPIRAVRLATKGGIGGQTREAYDNLKPGTPDLYLILKAAGGNVLAQTPAREDTPVGNGLSWDLSPPIDSAAIAKIEVWEDDVLGDTLMDQVGFAAGSWSAEGGAFRLDLVGERPTPRPWALPLAAVGGTLAGVVLLRFVWDQAL